MFGAWHRKAGARKRAHEPIIEALLEAGAEANARADYLEEDRLDRLTDELEDTSSAHEDFERWDDGREWRQNAGDADEW
jgi:hypothetical protein